MCGDFISSVLKEPVGSKIGIRFTRLKRFSSGFRVLRGKLQAVYLPGQPQIFVSFFFSFSP